MGTAPAFPEEAPERVAERLQHSAELRTAREVKHAVLTGLVKRAVSLPRRVDFWALPDPATFLILQFLASDLHILRTVSVQWYSNLLQVIDNAFSPIESQFALMHSDLLSFEESSLHLDRMQVSSRKGMRADRVLRAEILPLLKSHTIKLRYTYRFHNSACTYKAELKLDCVAKGKRTVWAHRDECKFHGEEQRRACTQQIPAVCVGDKVEFSITWLNLLGLVKLESIQWQPPLIQDTRAIIKSLQLGPEHCNDKYNERECVMKKLYLFNVSRYCEAELQHTEWYDARYYAKPPQLSLSSHFLPFLRLVKCEFTGTGIVISKNTFRAEACGIVPEAVSKIGVPIEVRAAGVTTEVKKIGLLHDRNRPLYLRVGDTFVLYISRSG